MQHYFILIYSKSLLPARFEPPTSGLRGERAGNELIKLRYKYWWSSMLIYQAWKRLQTPTSLFGKRRCLQTPTSLFRQIDAQKAECPRSWLVGTCTAAQFRPIRFVDTQLFAHLRARARCELAYFLFEMKKNPARQHHFLSLNEEKSILPPSEKNFWIFQKFSFSIFFFVFYTNFFDHLRGKTL